MPIPSWVTKWIEQLDDPIQNAVLLTSDEDRLHTSWCTFRQGNECNCLHMVTSFNNTDHDWTVDPLYPMTMEDLQNPPDDWE